MTGPHAPQADANAIAIVGMAVRVPGALSVPRYWQNLVDGVESIVPRTEEQLRDAGVSREALLRPGYVRAAAPLERMEWFDAEFFGFSPKDAAIMDPQHRHFLETCWEALEDAAHPPDSFDGAIGVFAGSGMAAYFAFNLMTNPELIDDVGMFLLRHTGNDKDFLVSRVSYLLDLQGPAVNVQTACSTSLVATHLAVQHLLSGECDMALAGGVTIEIPHGRGYQYVPDEILSPDGHCRAFDHRAGGTVFGSGAGVVVLRRLGDALADGDHVYAVIRGTAVNNDGARKVGYLAPSIDGQAACIAEALAVADVPAASLQYVECHGTGTAMGDPIEVAALTQAFTPLADGHPYCSIGSVKTNIGHLDTAAGVAGLIKASLALHHRAIPPSLHFERANPNIDLERSPFQVNATLRDWPVPAGAPRRAGVNSLGVGGTNAFVVLEEAPPQPVPPATSGPQLLTISARNRAALDDATRRLAEHLRAHPQLDLGDVAHTLHVGRKAFDERRVVAATTTAEAADLLERLDARRVFTHSVTGSAPSVVFLLPGGGAQYPHMAADLYAAEPVFRHHVDEGIRLAQSRHGLDLRSLLLPADDHAAAATELALALEHASVQLPCLFVIEHALAQLLIARDVRPSAMLGHSVGENVAACLAGTMSFADALGLVALRGNLMDRTRGGMLVVPLPADELAPLLQRFGLDLAAVNAPDLCVASGADEALASLHAHLAQQGVEAQRVRIHVAAHSRLLDPVLPEFRAYLQSIRLAAPTIPWVSNSSGTWVTTEQATDPEYWVGQLRTTVQFSAGIATIAGAWPDAAFVEVGPGRTLSSLARANPAFSARHTAVHSMRHPDEALTDDVVLLTSLGRLWASGGSFPTAHAFRHGPRPRLSLPTYAFQSQRYFIEPGTNRRDDVDELPLLDRTAPSEWFYEPVWKRRAVDEGLDRPTVFLVFADHTGVADAVSLDLRAAGHRVVTVRSGDAYRSAGGDEYVLAAEHGREGYERLVADLVRDGALPDRVVHLALLAEREEFRPGLSFFHRNQELGFYSLLFFMQAWAAEGLPRPLHVLVATADSQHVLPTDVVAWPEQATVLGPVLVLPHEFPDVTASAIDIAYRVPAPAGDARRATRGLRGPTTAAAHRAEVVTALVAEACAPATNTIVSVRGGQRFERSYRHASASEPTAFPLRRGGVVLITGGLGGIGLTLAERLHREVEATLVLLSREPLPPESHWDRLRSTLDAHHPTVQRIDGLLALRAAGAHVTVLHGDVTDISRMREVVAEVRSRYGALHGVVHAAGVTDDRLLLAKDQIDVERVLAAKVYGTLVLHELTRDDALDMFTVFSSTSAVTGPPGQIDYVAANAFLNSFAQANPQRVQAIAWGAWANTGMAAMAARRLLHRGADLAQPAATPWFTTRRVDEQGTVHLTARWSTAEWFLDEHRTAADDALLPGAAYLEFARAALAEAGVDGPFEISDLVLLAPLPAPDGVDTDVRATLTRSGSGYAFEVLTAVPAAAPAATEAGAVGGSTPGQRAWLRTAQAQILLRPPAAADPIDLADAIASCPLRANPRTRQHDHLLLGPRWNVVRRVHTGIGRAVAELELPAEFAADLDQTVLHPALFDIGLCFAIECVDGYTGDRLWVPLSIQSVVVHQPFDREPSSSRAVTVVAEVVAGSSEAAGFATFDVTFCDARGRVLVQVEGFTMKRLDGSLDLDPATSAGGTLVLPDDGETTRTLSRAEIVFRHNVEQGITAAEGADAFVRALTQHGSAPELIISSLDLGGLRHQLDAVSTATLRTAAGDTGMVFARPQLSSEYVEPHDAIERTLVGLWQELLGVGQVGVNDNFFDLGGHSLIAVRLFARLRKLYAIDLPISVLFQAQTVAAGAALVRSMLPEPTGGALLGSASGIDADSAQAAAGTPVTLPSRYTYLVPMHGRDNPDATPFFLVAGMFGNVLNLRHLANQIGTDRPFFGVQARGLFGGAQPHETFQEMAAAYLQEIRQVQPHGPYMLGGFSGGGITALEMAQQLATAGESTSLLVMLDTPAPSSGDALTRRDRIIIQLHDLARHRLGYFARWRRNRRAWHQQMAEKQQAHTFDEGALHSVEIEGAFYRALSRHRVGRYDGAITLLRPPQHWTHELPGGRRIDDGRNFVAADNGWNRHCDLVSVIEVPGDHDSMVLEPNVRVLAGHIRAAMEHAEHAQRAEPSRAAVQPV